MINQFCDWEGLWKMPDFNLVLMTLILHVISNVQGGHSNLVIWKHNDRYSFAPWSAMGSCK